MSVIQFSFDELPSLGIRIYEVHSYLKEWIQQPHLCRPIISPRWTTRWMRQEVTTAAAATAVSMHHRVLRARETRELLFCFIAFSSASHCTWYRPHSTHIHCSRSNPILSIGTTTGWSRPSLITMVPVFVSEELSCRVNHRGPRALPGTWALFCWGVQCVVSGLLCESEGRGRSAWWIQLLGETPSSAMCQKLLCYRCIQECWRQLAPSELVIGRRYFTIRSHSGGRLTNELSDLEDALRLDVYLETRNFQWEHNR